MIAPSRIAEVRRLLLEGRLTYPEIARKCGVSRNTVAAISAVNLTHLPAVAPDSEETSPPQETPRRCGVCGGLVYGRCRLCRARKKRQALRPPVAVDAFAALDGLLGLALLPAHQRRYEEIHALRMQSYVPDEMQENEP